jgi:hypothetical protein
MLLLRRKNRRRPVATASWGPTGRTMRNAAAVAVAVPAHGFVVSAGGNGLVSAVAESAPPIVGWMRTFLGACVWAFMIAAGSLIYSHFVKKWQAQGLPVLPVAALTAATEHSLQPRSNGAIPLGSGSPAPAEQAQRAHQPVQTSILDEYEG